MVGSLSLLYAIRDHCQEKSLDSVREACEIRRTMVNCLQPAAGRTTPQLHLHRRGQGTHATMVVAGLHLPAKEVKGLMLWIGFHIGRYTVRIVILDVQVRPTHKGKTATRPK